MNLKNNNINNSQKATSKSKTTKSYTCNMWIEWHLWKPCDFAVEVDEEEGEVLGKAKSNISQPTKWTYVYIP